jgi:electron transfer flavoprotein beta subunit
MELIVCVKRVAATDSKIRPGPDGKTLDPQGVEFVLNPYDEYAVEEAIRIKEAQGGTVTVVCLGPAEAQKEIRTCLAMECDQGVLLKDTNLVRDAYSIAEILAAKIKTMKFDLIFCGRQSVDADNSQVGQRLATLLGVPCVHEVTKLTVADGRLTAERDVEGGKEVVECPLPAVITTQKGLNEPRYANLKGIMGAKKKPLAEEAFADVAPALVVESMTPPPARPPGRILGKGAEAVQPLIDALRNEAKVL